jgi:translocation and assembly module TamB
VSQGARTARSSGGNLIDDDDNFSLAGCQAPQTLRSSVSVLKTFSSRCDAVSRSFHAKRDHFEGTRFTGPGTNIVLDGTLATASGGKQNLNVNGDLNMRVLNGVSPDFFSSGTAEVAVRINGSFEDPRMIGTASLNNASVSVLLGNERWTVAQLESGASVYRESGADRFAQGTLGGGRVSATGGALLEGFTVSAFRVSLHGDDVTVPFPPDFRSTLDADVEIRGSSREQLIGGLVNFAAHRIHARHRTGRPHQHAVASRSKKALRLNSRARPVRGTASRRKKRFRGAKQSRRPRRLCFASVGWTSQRSTISGRITATSGTLNFRNDRYDITRALVDLPPGAMPIRFSTFRANRRSEVIA